MIEAWRIDGATRSGGTIIREQGRHLPLDRYRKGQRWTKPRSVVRVRAVSVCSDVNNTNVYTGDTFSQTED